MRLPLGDDPRPVHTAFLDVGISGDMGLVWSLLHAVGGGRTREMLLFPGKFTAGEAHEQGLVTRLFDPETFHDEVAALARELAARPAFVLRMMKANVLSAETLPLAAYIDIESARHLHTVPDSPLSRS
ncbi:hypothetical protein NRB56_49030 [Nocardia sp. RB56]|uniref:Uncharacterized protein n=1 Tax=Nocardia aurantia TaxID=2585199 RepID=A0A7K0DU73_9NOCA|nr:hypothetical protein [Nocardia aurantia]